MVGERSSFEIVRMSEAQSDHLPLPFLGGQKIGVERLSLSFPFISTKRAQRVAAFRQWYVSFNHSRDLVSSPIGELHGVNFYGVNLHYVIILASHLPNVDKENISR